MTKKKTQKISIRPLDDRVVVEAIEGNEKTAGGIYLPDTAKEKPQEGVVIAVGPGKMLESGERAQLSVSVGDRILHGKYGGTEIEADGKEYLVMRESDILAKLED